MFHMITPKFSALTNNLGEKWNVRKVKVWTSSFSGDRSSTRSGAVEPIPEYSAKEEFDDAKAWRTVNVGDRELRIDMKVIEPYKKVLSHGGRWP